MSFTQNVITGSAADGEYVYYNATIVNNTVATTQTTDDPAIYFQDTRQFPLLKDTGKYVVSVDNFTLNGATKTLPVFVPQIAVGTDINLTIYTLTFGITTTQGGTARAFTATIPITWIPENQAPFTIVPTTATPNQLPTNYYFCYSYSHWVDLMNNALTSAWRDVMAKVGGVVGSTYGGTRCPFFEYNPSTGLFSLCQDSLTSYLPYGQVALTAGNVSSASAGVSDPFQPFAAEGASSTTTGNGSNSYMTSEFSFVGFNTNLEGLIANFDTIYFGGNSSILAVQSASSGGAAGSSTVVGNTANSYSYTATSSTVATPTAASSLFVSGSASAPNYYPENILNVNPDFRSDSIVTLPQLWGVSSMPTIYYIRETQDFISTGTLWSPIASFVLTTTAIPVRFEGIASPVTLGASNTGGTTGVSGAAQKVLLETPIDAVTADIWRGFIQYKPLVPLFSSLDPSQDGLTNLDIRIGWRSRLTNAVYPLTMYNGGSASCRLRFVRK
jgi:hypothetical protein